LCPPYLLEVSRGYFFNAKVPVGVDRSQVNRDGQGNLRDQFGAQVKAEYNPMTGEDEYVTYMPMIEASTRYLREDVDRTYLQLPFDPDLLRDMRGETTQRVQTVAGLKRKPNAFHDLDAMRAMAMRRRAGAIEELLAPEQEPVRDYALERSDYDLTPY
jgi:hypothetical protein